MRSLGWRILPNTKSLFFIGAAILMAGFLLAMWARFHLRRYWSASITLKEGHQLIRTGPYALVRHPIYTGVLLGALGTAIALGQVRGFMAVFLIAIAYWFKSAREEKMLLQEFGEEYTRYRQAVGALLPVAGTFKSR